MNSDRGVEVCFDGEPGNVEKQHECLNSETRVGCDEGGMNADADLRAPRPVTLRYDVSLSVDDFKNKERKCLLENAVGKAEPGDLVAIMGPSGSGKSTLLRVLSGRMPGYSGAVDLNGKSPQMSARDTLCFVEQDDLFIPTITPREHLRFTAKLRIGHTSEEDTTEAVDGLLKELGLEKCADSPIGAEGAMVNGRISGGERKRLSLATELLATPSVIFADEVTSGLDSFMAETVVMKLEQLARAGHTVLVSIHQPSSYMFSSFSHLHLLSDGQTVFSGRTNDALDYFASIGKPLPPLTNPADFYIKLLSSNVGKTAVIASWQEGSLVESLKIERFRREMAESESRASVFFQKKDFAAPWLKQLRELMARAMLSYRRDAHLGRIRLAQSVFLAILVGIIYRMIGESPIQQQNVQSVTGALFFAILNQGLQGSTGVMQVFPLEKPIFMRETSSKTYSVSAYVVGKFLADLPFQILFSFIFTLKLYHILGFGGSGTGVFFIFSLLVVLTTIAAVSYGYLISSISSTVGGALALAPLLLMPLVLFGGLLINLDNVDPWFVWIPYLSFFRYGFEGVMVIIWENQGELGKEVISSFSFDPDSTWRNVGILCGLTVGFRCLSWLFLEFRRLRL